MDGRLTVTGYSHDTGLCHSISMVEIKGGGGVSGSNAWRLMPSCK
jgi:hypothetical protein